MSLLVRAAPKEHWGWLAIRSGCIMTSDFQAIEAVDSAGVVRGMVGFDTWTPNSVHMHVALSSPLVARALIVPAFRYPLVQRKVGVLLASMPASNGGSVRLARALGFREAHRVCDGYAQGNDLVCFEMTRAECRWLEGIRKVA